MCAMVFGWLLEVTLVKTTIQCRLCASAIAVDRHVTSISQSATSISLGALIAHWQLVWLSWAPEVIVANCSICYAFAVARFKAIAECMSTRPHRLNISTSLTYFTMYLFSCVIRIRMKRRNNIIRLIAVILQLMHQSLCHSMFGCS